MTVGQPSKLKRSEEGEREKGQVQGDHSFCRHNQPHASKKKNESAKTESERSGQTRIGFSAWGLRESEKRNQAIGNSRESNVRESSGTADSEYPSLVLPK